VAANNFGWLGSALSVFRLAAAPDDSGWWQRHESGAKGARQKGTKLSFRIIDIANSN